METRNMGEEKITQEEKDAAVSLLISVFEIHRKESLLDRALDEFSCGYGDEIPDWFQRLYAYFADRDSSEIQMKVIRKYAEKHNLKISDGS